MGKAGITSKLALPGNDGQVWTSDGAAAGWEDLPVASATQRGVVKGGELPGSTSGAAIAAGYIGEVKSAAVNSVGSIGDGNFNTTNQLVLPAGVWLIAYYDGVYRESFSGTSGLYQQINAAIRNETDSTTVAQSGYFQYTHVNSGIDREMQYNGHFHVSYPINISAQKTFRGIVGGAGGGGRFATRGMGSFYAIRIA